VLSIRLRKPSARPDRTALLFLATLGFVVVAAAALIAMVVFTPRQNDANNTAAAYTRGVNQHTTYSNLLQTSVEMNRQIADLARSDNRMTSKNLHVARTTLSHAQTIQDNLDHIRPASGTAATVNLLINGESHAIAKTNGDIRNIFTGVNRSAHSVRAGVTLNNERNATILGASRAIAHIQAATAALQRRVLAHTRSIQCSPLVHACGSSSSLPQPRESKGPALTPTSPSAVNPTTALPHDAHHPPPLPAVPTRPSLVPREPHHTPPPALPLLGAIEAGAAASGASGAAAAALAVVRRRSRRLP
jgi:hypothetical protein